ncbi:hypothetical protein PG985_010463 [Apiospora marii]|uniref:uncharacterized protein n=1 Tax=Apiospora marii TaxID=335849 RepID=UPI003130A761
MSGGRVLGTPSHLNRSSNSVTCALGWNISHNFGANYLGVTFFFPKENVSEVRLSGEDADFKVEFLFEAPNYDITYMGPLDLDKMPLGIRMGAEGKELSVFKIHALNGAKPIVLGFPPEEASMLAKFCVPILERQDHILVAVNTIDDRIRGRVMQHARYAAMGPYRPVRGSTQGA